MIQQEMAMTSTQSQAVWALCRQGLPLAADEAEQCWSRGQAYHLDFLGQIPRSINALIEQCNWETETNRRLH
jgi:hypothetical protein